MSRNNVAGQGGQSKQPRPAPDQPQASAVDIPRLIDAYRDEQEKGRKQADRSDRARGWREWATLAFLIVTTGAVLKQCDTLQSTDNAAHEAYQATQRPFVTVSELKTELVDGLKPGEPGKPGVPQKYWLFTPMFQNSGNTLTKDLRIYSLAVFPDRS
jgi:hypothetical protein